VEHFKEKAFLPMTLNGALQDDFDALSTGFVQILPKDSHGRAVLYHEKHLANPRLHHRDSLIRVVFYICHVVSSDEEMQKKGFVLIQNSDTVLLTDIDRIYARKSTSLGQIVPIKLKAVHVPSPNLWPMHRSMVGPILMFVIPKNMRMRMHFYRTLEELEDYGISMHCLPLSIGGSFNRAVEHWIEERRHIEGRELDSND